MCVTKYWLTFIILIFLSCEPLQLNTEEIKIEQRSYYDIKGLINQQIKYLGNVSPEVQVIATVNGTREEQKIDKSDSLFWVRTLSLVNKADINQPALQGVYSEKDSVIHPTKNLKLKSFYPQQKQHTNVLYLNVYYDSTLSDIQYLETLVRDKNLLYVTERKMKLSFEDYQGKRRIKRYEVFGKQKIIFGDTIHFTTTVIPVFHD
jgi:hypothetical protein